jgi:Zn-dependent protease with chaperone function
MFVLRGIAVSLTFFVLLYCALSALVAVAWRALKVLHATERSIAGWLFALRVLPLAASVAITFAVVVPSFQLLEPRSMDIDEGMGAIPLAMGICALVLIASGCYRVITAQTQTARLVRRWLNGAHPLDVDAISQIDAEADAQRGVRCDARSFAQGVAFRSKDEAPPLLLVGVGKPRVLVSESAVALLSHDELRIALKHEFAHMKSRDNLKKLICRFCPFPGMAKLESAWSQAAELAADDAAVSNLDDAVDLAAALVKLSRLSPLEAAPVCAVGFVSGSISARVARLLAWNEGSKAQPRRDRPWYLIPAILVSLSFLCVSYGPALALTHEVTEWLVR